MARYNLSFAGAGRVAGALCREMYHSGNRIVQVVSESEKDGRFLAKNCKALWSQELIFDESNDIIVVAVPDQKLAKVLSRIECSEKSVVVHTAGSYGLGVFPGKLKNKGVFYPLQTFSKGRRINFKNLPFLLEASDPVTGDILKKLAESVRGQTYFVDAEHRQMIHLAAVFVNNFTNYMLTAGKEIALKAGLSFELLAPLIKETVSKALGNGPENSQTGPAVRNDSNTIEKHLELLSFSPDLQNIYREVTQSIINHYKEGS